MKSSLSSPDASGDALEIERSWDELLAEFRRERELLRREREALQRERELARLEIDKVIEGHAALLLYTSRLSSKKILGKAIHDEIEERAQRRREIEKKAWDEGVGHGIPRRVVGGGS